MLPLDVALAAAVVPVAAMAFGARPPRRTTRHSHPHKAVAVALGSLPTVAIGLALVRAAHHDPIFAFVAPAGLAAPFLLAGLVVSLLGCLFLCLSLGFLLWRSVDRRRRPWTPPQELWYNSPMQSPWRASGTSSTTLVRK